MTGPQPRVVVVGAGFAGLQVVRRLASKPVDVTLLDQRNYNTFHPLLYQVATAGIDEGDVARPVRAIFAKASNVDVQLGRVVGLDRAERTLRLADGAAVHYDQLVLAAGATTNDFGIPGVAAHAFPLYTLTEAIQLREHILGCFEATERQPELADAGALTCLIVGGGPTGVETAGTLAELFSNVLSKGYRRAPVERARVVLLEMGSELLAQFRPASRRHALQTLTARRVEIRFGARVAAVAEGSLTLSTSETLTARTVVWTAGVRANPLADNLGLRQTRDGRIVVGPDLAVPDAPEIFVVGDLAAPSPDGRVVVPQLAPAAMQEGRHVGDQILRQLDGQSSKPFHYRDKGTMATIGRRAAVADLPFAVSLRGTVAWLAWLFLHLIFLMGFENRAKVFVQWAWNYVTWDWGPRLFLEASDQRAP